MKINRMNAKEIIETIKRLGNEDRSKYKAHLLRRLETLSDKEVKLMR
jgi:hypothetical protein